MSLVHSVLQVARRLGRTSAVFGLVWAGTAGGADVLHAQISATPVVIRVDASDTVRLSTVIIRNDGTRQAQVRFYAEDFTQGEGGEYDFRPYGTTAGSCAARMSVTPDNAVLLPGEQQAVQIRLQPGSTPCWNMIFAESSPQGQGSFRYVERIGIRYMNVPAKLRREVEVEEVTASIQPHDSVQVRAQVHNIGEAAVEARGRVEIRDLSGEVLHTIDFGPMGILPGIRRDVVVMIPARLREGRYIVVPIVDFGGEFLAGGQAALTVPSR